MRPTCQVFICQELEDPPAGDGNPSMTCYALLTCRMAWKRYTEVLPLCFFGEGFESHGDRRSLMSGLGDIVVVQEG